LRRPICLQEGFVEADAFLVAGGYVRGCGVAGRGLKDTGCGLVWLDGMNFCGGFVRRVLDFADHVGELPDVGWRRVCDVGFAADPCSIAEDR
jgi:hypothetical protein